MNGNGQENQDKKMIGAVGGKGRRVSPLSGDPVEGAITEKLERGRADEERFGFAAAVANATPPVDAAFRQTLRDTIVAEAAQTMERQRETRIMPHRGREMNTRRWYPTLRIAFTLAATAALFAFVFLTPWGQTLAQSALRFFVRTERTTFPLEPSQIATTVPDASAPTAEPPAPLITIAEAEAQAGFDVAELPFVPEGFDYRGARVYDRAVTIEYEAQGGGGSLIIMQSPEGFVESRWGEVPDDAIVPVKIGEVDGEFARGTFVVYAGDTTATWNPDAPLLRLRWVKDGIWFQMTRFGDVEATAHVDRARLAELAAAVGERTPVANAGPQLSPEDIDALARRLSEEQDPRTVAVFPADYAPALAEHIAHEVVPLAVGDDLAPAAVQATLGAALPRSGLVDVVLVDQDGGETAKRVRASLEQQLYRLYRGPGDSGAETFGALERKRYVAGYVAGIGLVEEDPTLRILAEPVTLTRGGFTVEVDHALLTGDRTVVHYRVESADGYPFAEPGTEDTPCLEYAHLRLPDGSTLQPQPTGNGKAFGSGYEFATSFRDPIPPDVAQGTLIIPCLLDSVRGEAPENWELALSFTPAPPDMELAPVYDAAEVQTATDQSITVDLEYVVVEENGYLFNLGLVWNRDGEHKPALYPSSLHVTDVTGRKILLSNANGRPPMPQNLPGPFTFRTSEMPAPGPLTLSLEAVRASFPVDDVSFTFDPGSDPQPGQVWALDEHFSVAGYEWDVTSARMVVQDGGPTVGDVEGFSFTMESADPDVTMSVQLRDAAHPLATFEPVFPERTVFSGTLTYENGIPAGPITVKASQVSVLIRGEWQIRWASPPEGVAGSAASQPIGVTFNNGIELVAADVLDDPQPGEPLRVALEWRAEDPVDDPVTVFAHLMCEGRLLAQRDAIPGNGEFPAPNWQPGEVIRDQFALQLPAELPVGACQIQVGIYNPDSGRRYSPVGLEGAPHVVIERFSVRSAGETL